MSEIQLGELQGLMKMYRDGLGYVRSPKDLADLTKGMSEDEKDEFLKKTFFLAVVRQTADYVERIEKESSHTLDDKAYKVAVSLIMGAFDIANLYGFELSETVMETLMEKFTSDAVTS